MSLARSRAGSTSSQARVQLDVTEPGQLDEDSTLTLDLLRRGLFTKGQDVWIMMTSALSWSDDLQQHVMQLLGQHKGVRVHPIVYHTTEQGVKKLAAFLSKHTRSQQHYIDRNGFSCTSVELLRKDLKQTSDLLVAVSARLEAIESTSKVPTPQSSPKQKQTGHIQQRSPDKPSSNAQASTSATAALVSSDEEPEKIQPKAHLKASATRTSKLRAESSAPSKDDAKAYRRAVAETLRAKARPSASQRIDVHDRLTSGAFLAKYGMNAVGLALHQALKPFAQRANAPGEVIGNRYKTAVKMAWADGGHRTITVDPAFIARLYRELKAAQKQYSQRLQWLGSGSRRLFGVIVEPVVTLCLEVTADTARCWPLLLRHLKRVITEQLAKATYFNVHLYNNQVYSFAEHVTPASKGQLKRLWQWLKGFRVDNAGLGRDTHKALSVAVDGLEPQLHGEHGIYLMQAGPTPGVEDMLLAVPELLQDKKTHVHTIAYNCHGETKVRYFLQQLANQTDGRYHLVLEEGHGLDSKHAPTQRWAVDPQEVLPAGATKQLLMDDHDELELLDKAIDTFTDWLTNRREAELQRQVIRDLLRKPTASATYLQADDNPDPICLCHGDDIYQIRVEVARAGLYLNQLEATIMDMHPETGRLVVAQCAGLGFSLPEHVTAAIARSQAQLDAEHDQQLHQLALADEQAKADSLVRRAAPLPDYLTRRRQELSEGKLSVEKPQRRQTRTTPSSSSRYMLTKQSPPQAQRVGRPAGERSSSATLPAAVSSLPDDTWLNMTSIKAQRLNMDAFLGQNSILQLERNADKLKADGVFSVRYPSKKRRGKQRLIWLVTARPHEFQAHQTRLAQLIELYDARIQFVEKRDQGNDEEIIQRLEKARAAAERELSKSRELASEVAAAQESTTSGTKSADQSSRQNKQSAKPRWNEGPRSNRRQASGSRMDESTQPVQPADKARRHEASARPGTTRSQVLRKHAIQARHGTKVIGANVLVIPSEDEDFYEGQTVYSGTHPTQNAHVNLQPDSDMRAQSDVDSLPTRDEAYEDDCIDAISSNDNASFEHGLSRHASVRRVAGLLAEVDELEHAHMERTEFNTAAEMPATSHTQSAPVRDVKSSVSKTKTNATFGTAPRVTDDYTRTITGLLAAPKNTTAKVKPEAFQLPDHTVIVKGISDTCQPEDLRNLFITRASLLPVHVHIPWSFDLKCNKDFGYASFASQLDADQACQLQTVFQGKSVMVQRVTNCDNDLDDDVLSVRSAAIGPNPLTINIK
eukprot:TRINITY_DN12676_c2_g3_i8.p1 TRINITY_DN12676_c2_g3~~TRINITY_DN12676_c2_g3_i8.p1  ORF type:complete len:1315 (+),score=246.63 TRINITY_DN12676_c2_g3_i8:145-3945(+)